MISASSTDSSSTSATSVVRSWADLLEFLRQNPRVDAVIIGPYFAAIRIGPSLTHVADTISGGSVASNLAQSLTDDERNQKTAVGQITLRQQHPGIGLLKIRLFRTNGADAATITRSVETAPAIDDRAVPAAFLRALARPSGLALLAGPFGSGLEATHAAITQYLAAQNPDAIVAYIGSPPAYQLAGVRSLPIYLEIGQRKDVTRYSTAIAMASEDGAKIIAVDGALETLDGVREVLRAARAGALVLATVRASTAVETLQHLHTLLPANERDHWWATLAEQLLGVLAVVRVPGRFPGSDFPAPDTLVRTPALLPQLLAFDPTAIAAHVAHDRDQSRGRDAALLDLMNQVQVTPETARAYAINPERLGKR